MRRWSTAAQNMDSALAVVAQVGDVELAQELSAAMAHLPSYGYRRARAIERRLREARFRRSNHLTCPRNLRTGQN